MAGLALLVDGSVALAPVDKVLSEARVLQFLTQLFRLHQVVLQLLHILNIN